MKIAIFFLVVAISSCFVDAQSPLAVPGVNGVVLGGSGAQQLCHQLVFLILQLTQLNNCPDTCRRYALCQKIFELLDLIAALCCCPYQVVVMLLLGGLSSGCDKNSVAALEAALLSRSVEALFAIGLALDVVVGALVSVVALLAAAAGLDFLALLAAALQNLAGLLSLDLINGVLGFLGNAGFNLNCTVQQVGGVVTLVIGLVTAVVSGALNQITDLTVLQAIFVNLGLGPIYCHLLKVLQLLGGSLSGLLNLVNFAAFIAAGIAAVVGSAATSLVALLGGSLLGGAVAGVLTVVGGLLTVVTGTVAGVTGALVGTATGAVGTVTGTLAALLGGH